MTDANALQLPPRWDGSRSSFELERRLVKLLEYRETFAKPQEKKEGAGDSTSATKKRLPRKDALAIDLSLDPPVNLEPVKALLTRDAGQSGAEVTRAWCTSVAIIQTGAKNSSELDLTEFLKGIAETVSSWNNIDLFVQVADKMKAQYVSPWFECTLAVKGAEYLIEATMNMPYRLWGNTEKLLATDEVLSKQFADKVLQELRSDKATADHFYWLWRAPKATPDRDKLLARPYVLFRLLGHELKGNYLKAQKDLRRLLLQDENFMRALTLQGDDKVGHDLINCARRIALLNTTERQTLLVKLCALYPELTQYVAHRASQPQLNIPPSTSPRSYKELQKRLQNLVDVEIPANAEAIKTAKAHGDLSENSEYKAAKERQRELGKLRLQLDQQITNISPVNYSQVRVGDVVVPGLVVTVKYAEDGHSEKFTILGMLDNDPDRNYIAYNSPLGKALVGKSLGSEVTLPNRKVVTIEKLEQLPADLLEQLEG